MVILAGLEAILGPLGTILEPLGAILEPLGAVLEPGTVGQPPENERAGAVEGVRGRHKSLPQRTWIRIWDAELDLHALRPRKLGASADFFAEEMGGATQRKIRNKIRKIKTNSEQLRKS